MSSPRAGRAPSTARSLQPSPGMDAIELLERDHKTIRFSVELDVSTNPPTFQVQIAGDDCDMAIRQASEEIRSLLEKGVKIPAYIGSHPLAVTQ